MSFFFATGYSIGTVSGSKTKYKNIIMFFVLVFAGIFLMMVFEKGLAAKISLIVPLLIAFAFLFRFYQELIDITGQKPFIYCYFLIIATICSVLIFGMLLNMALSPFADIAAIITAAANIYAMYKVQNVDYMPSRYVYKLFGKRLKGETYINRTKR